MDIKIKRVDKNFPLPEYKTSGAAAFDLYTREARTIAPNEVVYLPSNLIIKVPDGHVLVLSARSSLSKKKGLFMANGIGIIDSDFCGNDDEMSIAVFNASDKDISVEAGERIVQGTLVKFARPDNWVEVDDMEAESRGGFGSTGKF